MLTKGLLYFYLKLLKCRSKVFSTSIWNCSISILMKGNQRASQPWNLKKGDQRSSLLQSGLVKMSIKGLLYFNLDLLKCPPNVISTSIWTCWNVEQMSSLLRSGLVEMSIKGLLWYGLVEMSIKGLLYFDLKLLNLNLDERQPKGFLMLELEER